MRFALLFSFLALFIPSISFAGEISIVDSSGGLRAAAMTDGTGTVNVTFREGQAPGQIKLKNRETGDVIEGVIVGNVVVFEGISAGTWELIAAPELLAAATVTINVPAAVVAGPGGGGSTLVGAGIVGGAAGGGAAAAGVISGNESGKSGPLSPAS